MAAGSRRARNVAGFVVGAIAAAALVLAWRVPGGSGVAGLDVTVLALPSGEVGLTPPGPAFHANGLLPGSPAGAGAFDVVNRTGSSVAVRVRAVPSDAGGIQAIRFEVRSGAERIFAGSLGQLRSWTSGEIHLAPGATASLGVRVWVAPGSAPPQVTEETVTLLFAVRPEVGA